MRKQYLDHIRWITIVLVVIFHIFFYYNNIGTAAIFEGLPEYEGNVTFGGLYQYFVYPWFMLLLFVVAGISARYALKNRTGKQFMRARVDKLLVPSTLGILAFGWIGGLVLYLHNVGNTSVVIPVPIRVMIILLSGTGALWFCHVLFVSALVLMAVRWLLRRCRVTDDSACQWFERKMQSLIGLILLLVLMYLILWGSAHILNMPLVTSYRNGIYISAFFMGYYIFSNDGVITWLKKGVPIFLVAAAAAGIFYIYRCYGLAYIDIQVLSRWDLNLFAFLMVLLVLGASARFLDWRNAVTDYMKQTCFGIYVFHIPVMLVTNYLLVGAQLPIAVVYVIELVSALVCSILLYEAVRRIPVLRYWILGIRKRRS